MADTLLAGRSFFPNSAVTQTDRIYTLYTNKRDMYISDIGYIYIYIYYIHYTNKGICMIYRIYTLRIKVYI